MLIIRYFLCCRYWLINGRGFAKKIRYATHCADRQISELGAEARMECPNCKYYIDNSDVSTFGLFGLGRREIWLSSHSGLGSLHGVN
jgi:hypothetical protein